MARVSVGRGPGRVKRAALRVGRRSSVALRLLLPAPRGGAHTMVPRGLVAPVVLAAGLVVVGPSHAGAPTDQLRGQVDRAIATLEDPALRQKPDARRAAVRRGQWVLRVRRLPGRKTRRHRRGQGPELLRLRTSAARQRLPPARPRPAAGRKPRCPFPPAALPAAAAVLRIPGVRRARPRDRRTAAEAFRRRPRRSPPPGTCGRSASPCRPAAGLRRCRAGAWRCRLRPAPRPATAGWPHRCRVRRNLPRRPRSRRSRR